MLLKWGAHAFAHGTEHKNMDFVSLFDTALTVQLLYRVVSIFAVYNSEKSLLFGVPQMLDLLMLREVFVSHLECRPPTHWCTSRSSRRCWRRCRS